MSAGQLGEGPFAGQLAGDVGAVSATLVFGVASTRIPVGNSSGTGLTSFAALTYDDGAGLFLIAKSLGGSTVRNVTSNTSNTASSSTEVKSQVAGSSAGNPQFILSVSGGNAWTFGLDNPSTNDDLVLGRGTGIGTQAMRVFYSSSDDIRLLVGPGSIGSGNLQIAGMASSSITLGSTSSTGNSSIALNNNNSSARPQIVSFGSAAVGNTFGTAAAATSSFSTLAGDLKIGTSAASDVILGTNDAERLRILSGGNLQFADAINIVFNATTGTKIGTATTQKLAFYNSAPIAQPSSTGETVGFTAGGGTTVTDASTFTGNVGTKAYRISDIVKHLKNLGLIASS